MCIHLSPAALLFFGVFFIHSDLPNNIYNFNNYSTQYITELLIPSQLLEAKHANLSQLIQVTLTGPAGVPMF